MTRTQPDIRKLSEANIDWVVRRILRRHRDMTLDQLETSFRRSVECTGLKIRTLLNKSVMRLKRRGVLVRDVEVRLYFVKHGARDSNPA